MYIHQHSLPLSTMLEHDHLFVFQQTIFETTGDRGAAGDRSSTGLAVCSSKKEKGLPFR